MGPWVKSIRTGHIRNRISVGSAVVQKLAVKILQAASAQRERTRPKLRRVQAAPAVFDSEQSRNPRKALLSVLTQFGLM